MVYSFGNWVKRRRKALDLTQQELAQRVGCSLSAIFKIESDERRPSRQIAKLLAQYLEIHSDQMELFLKELETNTAKGLFIKRAGQAHAGFKPNREELSAIALILACLL